MAHNGTPGTESQLERGTFTTHDYATDDEPIPRQDSPVSDAPGLRQRLPNGLPTDTNVTAGRGGTLKSLGGTTVAPTPVDGSTTLPHQTTQRSQMERRGLPRSKADPRRDTGVPPTKSWQDRMKSLLIPKKKVGQAPSMAGSFKSIIFSSWLNILLVFIPVSWALHYAKVNDTVVFVCAFFAIIPLAKLLAFATEEMAIRVGETLGGLLNATLGNAVELIVAIIALTHCQLQVVQASLIGSILSNLLLVLGMCFFAGGIKYSTQGFMLGAAQLNSSLLTLSVVGILIPATFHAALDSNPNSNEGIINNQGERILKMSRGVAVILLFIYACNLVYQLWTHAHLYDNKSKFAESALPSMRYPKRPKSKLFHRHHGDKGEGEGSAAQSDSTHHNGEAGVGSPQQIDGDFRSNSYPMSAMSPTSGPPEQQHAHFTETPQQPEEESESLRVVHNAGDEEEETPQISLSAAIVLLVAVTVLVAFTAEFLVDSINGVVAHTALSQEWVGLILLPIVGNAAEHVTAVTVSVKDKLDLSIGVAVGSSIQIALLVIPFIVVLAWIIGKPLTLLFDPFEAVVLFLTVITVNYVVQDGQSNWLEGMILMCLYLVIAVALWFYPGIDPASQLLQCK